jgi:hypothetical protein
LRRRRGEGDVSFDHGENDEPLLVDADGAAHGDVNRGLRFKKRDVFNMSTKKKLKKFGRA